MGTFPPATLRVIEKDGTIGMEYPMPESKAARPDPFVDRSFKHEPAIKPTDVYLDQYVEWRKTKCKPVDASSQLQDLDQATLEFVGEVAELCEMIDQEGPNCFLAGTETRAKFLGEIGDVMFTGGWLGDAWGDNPMLAFDGQDARNFLTPAAVQSLETFRAKLNAAIVAGNADSSPQMAWVKRTALVNSINAGLLCNAAKKLVYQRRAQDRLLQTKRIAEVLIWAACLAAIADATVVDCLAINIKKLDHRYPYGYQGPGGGNRTGVGA